MFPYFYTPDAANDAEIVIRFINAAVTNMANIYMQLSAAPSSIPDILLSKKSALAVPVILKTIIVDIILNAGEEYDINITILYDSFVIKGNKALWQDGGKIPLPFYPN